MPHAPRMRALATAARSRIALVGATVGLLPLLVAAATLAGAALHLRYYPGVPYTWAAPARILWNVFSGAYFAVFALGVFGLGFLTRLRDDPAREDLERYVAGLGRAESRERLRRAAVVAAGAVALAWGLMPHYTLADLLSVFIAGLYLGLRRPGARDWARFAGELLLVVLLFTAVSYSFTVAKSLLFRFTTPHDAQILALERALFLGATPHRLIAAWAAERPWAVWLSDRVYYLFFQHMFFVTILLVGAGRREDRLEYTAALALCYVLGGGAYYLWAGRGPFAFDPDAYPYLRELPTVTARFQRLLEANTARAAQGKVELLQTYEYIACMPSLHMGHELAMLWYTRRSRPFLALSLAFSVATLFAIVILGWHYPIDALAGAALAAVAVAVARRCKAWLLPAILAPVRAAAPVPAPAPPPAAEPASTRAGLGLALAAAALLAVPFLAVKYAPITDLPQQVAQIRLLGEALGEPGSPYRIQWATPYLVSYLYLGLSWLAAGPAAAGRMAMMAIGLSWVAAAWWLARRRGRPAEAVALAALLFFNHTVYWGFYSFACGLPAFLVWFAYTDELPPRLGWRQGTAVVALGAVLYACHALWLAAGLAWLFVHAALRHGRRGLVTRALAVVPLLAVAGVWWAAFRQTSFSTPPVWGEREGRLLPGWLADAALGGLRGPSEVAALAGLAIWAAIAVYHHRRHLARAVDGPMLWASALLLGLALVLPDKFMNTIRLPQRWIPGAALLALLALPPLPGPVRRRGAVAVALLAAFSFATVTAWRHFERTELGGLDAALAALPERPRVIGLDLVKESPTIEGRPFLQTFAWAQVLRGGELNFSFAEFAPSLVVFREARPLAWTPGLEWRAERVTRTDLARFEFVMANGTPEAHLRLAALRELTAVTDGLPWRLYRVDPELSPRR